MKLDEDYADFGEWRSNALYEMASRGRKMTAAAAAKLVKVVVVTMVVELVMMIMVVVMVLKAS